jgi:hypothetical protein
MFQHWYKVLGQELYHRRSCIRGNMIIM